MISIFLFILLTISALQANSLILHDSLSINEKSLRLINQNIKRNCPSLKKIEVTPMEPFVIQHTPNELGRVNNPRWIEINPIKWNNLTEEAKKNLLIHELGHTIGLEHESNKNSVMGVNNTDLKLDFISFWKIFKKRCPK